MSREFEQSIGNEPAIEEDLAQEFFQQPVKSLRHLHPLTPKQQILSLCLSVGVLAAAGLACVIKKDGNNNGVNTRSRAITYVFSGTYEDVNGANQQFLTGTSSTKECPSSTTGNNTQGQPITVYFKSDCAVREQQ